MPSPLDANYDPTVFPDPLRFDTVDGVACKEQLLRLLRADLERPATEGRDDAVGPGGRVAEAGILGGEDDVALADEVVRTREAPAVDLGDDRLRRAPHTHELLGRSVDRRGPHEVLARIPPTVRAERVGTELESPAEVIAAAERALGPAQDDHFDRLVADR